MPGRLSRRVPARGSLALPLAGALAGCSSAGRRHRVARATRSDHLLVRAARQPTGGRRVQPYAETGSGLDFQQLPSGGQGGYAKLSNAARAGKRPGRGHHRVPASARLRHRRRRPRHHRAGQRPAPGAAAAERMGAHHVRRPGLHRSARCRTDGHALSHGPVRPIRARVPRTWTSSPFWLARSGAGLRAAAAAFPTDAVSSSPRTRGRRRPLVRHRRRGVERLADRRADPPGRGVLQRLIDEDLLFANAVDASNSTPRSAKGSSWLGSPARGRPARR